MLTPEWCKSRNLYYETENNTLYAFESLTDEIKNELIFLLGGIPRLIIVPESELKKRLNLLEEKISASDFEFNDDKTDVARTTEGNSLELVNRLISEAIASGASDIHLEPIANKVRVRNRLFGFLNEKKGYPQALHRSVIARLKIMSGLDIAETRRPLDGNIRVANNQRQVDIRLSTMPTRFGEKAVLRILDKSRLKLSLNELGFLPSQLKTIRKSLKHKNGVIICTGPTGSGKTTTLYSMLTELNRTEVNILTIEDPIEYELQGVNQSQVNTAINLTFATAIRAFLRQDPDIIMVGEIRDEETTEIALRAAMTGHLVLTTLHTNTPEGARQRLIDLGGSPFIIDDTLRMVIGQELQPVIKDGQIMGRSMRAKVLTQ